MYIVTKPKKTVILIVCFAIVLSCSYLVNLSDESAVNTTPDTVPTKLIIDAGHGGFDPGANSDSGLKEKDINLDIALKLRDLLKGSKFEVILTRDGDFDLSDNKTGSIKSSDIKNRFKIVEENADSVYLGIHMNKFPQKKYSGAQVFYSKNNEKSEKLAELLQNNLRMDVQPENDRQIKKATSSIYLLNKATVPAVLVECGFLSNDDEANLLSTESYRLKIAESIKKSILYYFEYERLMN